MNPFASTNPAASGQRPAGPRPFVPSRATRVYAAAAAALCAAAVIGSVLSLFALASSDPWLRPTPELLEAMAQCRAAPERAAREQCARATLAEGRSNNAADKRLAQRNANAPLR